MATRTQNEKEYRNWENLPGGGRRYWRDRMGRANGFQRFVKMVDADENTLQVVQEVIMMMGSWLNNIKNSHRYRTSGSKATRR